MVPLNRRGFLAGVVASAVGSGNVQGAAATADEKGKVVSKKVRFGQFFQYLPKGEPVGVLVVVHGQPAGNDIQNIPGLAERFATRWVEFAEAHRLIVIAPVFDAENFDSMVGTNGGGYRGLFGRQIGADAYVEGMVNSYQSELPKTWDRKFLLYGHSAGAQFVNRYVVIHPDRIKAAVISAAGGFAMPDSTVRWSKGMGSWSTTFRWGPAQEPQAINVKPDPAGWLKAATLPLTVIVGSADIEPQKPAAGHNGSTRVEYARQWVTMMNTLAERRRKKGQVKLVIVEGVGHDSAKLTPAAMDALGVTLKAE